MMVADQFSQLLLSWFATHGRKNLPWQQAVDPYRVWISEIMLQQTQVSTVIPYFERFIQHFPDVVTLANANIDTVLHLWTGLGYYARARHLHRTAQIIIHEYAGKFPSDLETLQKLPGIGRSTAGAILSLAMHKSAPILDGNVKRVLTRVHAIAEWPGYPAVTKQLWELATTYTPQKQCAAYTQAIMDLGATVCTRSQPKCNVCPFNKFCLAHQQACETDYPKRKPPRLLPQRSRYFLMISNSAEEILLEKRPPVGLWGGLWSFPECSNATNIIEWCERNYHCKVNTFSYWPAFRHTFSHFHLDITPVHLKIAAWQPPMMDSDNIIWYKTTAPHTYGLPAPIKYLLNCLGEGHFHDSPSALCKTE